MELEFRYEKREETKQQRECACTGRVFGLYSGLRMRGSEKKYGVKKRGGDSAAL
jgi:hypothetical protein